MPKVYETMHVGICRLSDTDESALLKPRLGGKFYPRYLPVEFTGISRHGK